MTLLIFRQNLLRNKYLGYKHHNMRSAIGFLIVLWALSQYFGQAMSQFDATATASFKTLEIAAQVAQQELVK